MFLFFCRNHFFFCIEEIFISLSGQLLALSHFCKVSKRLLAGFKGKTCPFWHFGKSFILTEKRWFEIQISKSEDKVQSFFSTHRNLVPVLILPNVFYLLLTLLPKHWLSVHFTWIWLETWWALESFCYCMQLHILCLHCKGKEKFNHNFDRRFYWRTGKPTDCRRPGKEIYTELWFLSNAR